jgi:hypothetical protein
MESNISDPPFLAAVLCCACLDRRHRDRPCGHVIERRIGEQWRCQCGDQAVMATRKQFRAAGQEAIRQRRVTAD